MSRQVPESTPKRILLSADVVSYCSEAAKILRATSAIDDVEVQGEVTSLERTYEASDGTITVSGVVDGKPRRILFVAVSLRLRIGKPRKRRKTDDLLRRQA